MFLVTDNIEVQNADIVKVGGRIMSALRGHYLISCCNTIQQPLEVPQNSVFQQKPVTVNTGKYIDYNLLILSLNSCIHLI